ncbi:hypothetical protein BASA83_004941 [Batrachochytrium salamandrivorans]|nr:hypothetical protein BASA83_004941 [Batrachochytrium salamandrivorans]
MSDHPPNEKGLTDSSSQQQQQQHGLSTAQIERYSRQLLLPDIGVHGQSKLCNSSVLVVGAGGLGSPAILYLAAAGIGHLGIVDYDAVEASNLQRQIIHSEDSIGALKTDSAAASVHSLSSLVRCTTFNTLIDRSNVLDILKSFDLVVDGTDNVTTRYLLNDACVLLGKTLVSGSALRMDGQLTVYNHQGGPCYRCIFPVPPPPETVSNCNQAGVLGVVPGIIGCIQALEVIKIVSGMQTSYSQKMLLFDATQGSFRTVKLRGKNPSCEVCGTNPTITEPIDYIQFCGVSPHDKTPDLQVSGDDERISVKEYHSIVMAGTPHLLLDVREKVQYDICSLSQSHHIPLAKLESNIDCVLQLRETVSAEKSSSQAVSIVNADDSVSGSAAVPIYVVCRRGNDSQLAVQKLKGHGVSNVFDIVGGLKQWAVEIDPSFPKY